MWRNELPISLSIGKEDVYGMIPEGESGLSLTDRQLVRTSLTDEYELDKGGKTQPSVNIDNLLFTA